MQLKNILKNLIEESGISISHLSRKTNVPAQTISNWLSGVEPRSLNQVKKVADCFNVTLDYLCFGIKSPSSTKIQDFNDEIYAGVFEVVLRRINKKN